jgi:hypothetical protein
MTSERVIDRDWSQKELVERNRQYLLAVLKHHPELAHMVPPEMLIKAKPKPKLIKPEPEPKPHIDVLPLPPKPMHQAAAEVATQHGITVEELIGRSRSPKYTPARGDFVAACRKSNTSYQKIGLFMSGRDWATIIHYEKKRLWALQEAA